MQSIGGRTSSQQHQFQEPSQPQHSRPNKFSFQGPACVRAPENTTLYNIYKGPAPSRVNYKTAKPPGQSWVPAALPFHPTMQVWD